MSKASKASAFLMACKDVRRPAALFVIIAFATLLTAVYPSDLDSYAVLSDAARPSAGVDLTERYLRFVPSVLSIALPVALGDKVGAVQLVYTGVSATIATHAAKRILNGRWVRGTRLGQRPSGRGSKHNMPSGHSSMAASAVYFIGRRYSFRLAVLLLPILILTMYARVISSNHTVSAVIAGALLGILAAALFTSPRSEGWGWKRPEQPQQGRRNPS